MVQVKRESVRNAILDSARDLFSERGYAATTTLEVQKQAGVSRGVLLHYFGSRGELISAAARRVDVAMWLAAVARSSCGRSWSAPGSVASPRSRRSAKASRRTGRRSRATNGP